MNQSEPPDNRNINALLAVMAQLRNPQGGCPWDLEQNFKTIAPYTIEEAYEVADAIGRGDMAALKEELGDLLFQAVFHAQMAQERGLFDFGDVVAAITDKMVRRHPHIFADADLRSADEQTDAWEHQKAEERSAKGYDSLLDDVPVGHAGLTRAVKLQKRAARVGFDWTDAGDVLNKIVEETRELTEAIDNADPDAIEDEFGDLLFVLANLSRHLKVDPEAALRRSNEKFIRRFQFIEREVARSERNMDAVSLDEMEALWNQAKATE
ncbi:MAG: nucleoside triphosphate pyrophosphohydrolase [Alphaproteobacteria bacterium]|nr:nucleoside triphosphate pyrophosphohydrolase [Alphaproteobacteria bacterium]